MGIEIKHETVAEAQQAQVEAQRIVSPEVPFFGGAVALLHIPYAGDEPPPQPVRQKIVDANYPA